MQSRMSLWRNRQSSSPCTSALSHAFHPGVGRCNLGTIFETFLEEIMSGWDHRDGEAGARVDGCECVSRVLQNLTDLDPRATILSVDGVGAFDLVSHNATLQGLMGMQGGDRVLPFCQTLPWPSQEDGEPLLPSLDDLHVVSTPERTVAVHDVLREELWRHAKISVHHGKTRIWNRGGFVQNRCHVLEEAARVAAEFGEAVIMTDQRTKESPSWAPQWVERELAKIIC